MNTQLLGQKVLKVLSVTAALLLGSPVIAAESGAADSLDKNDLKLDKLLQKEGIEVPEKSKASKKDGNTAETSKSTDEKSEKTGISPGKTLSETTPSPFQFLIFFGGAALLALGAWVFKRYRHEFGNGEAIPMDHLQSMQIGHKHQLSVVQVGGETLLLGVTKDNVEMLSKLTDENLGTAQQNPTTSPGSNSSPLSSWKDVIQQAKDGVSQATGGSSNDVDEGYDGYEPQISNANRRPRTNGTDTNGNQPNGNSVEAPMSQRNNRESHDIKASLEKLKQRGGGLS
jgi:flagellar biogenesis protein FliO